MAANVKVVIDGNDGRFEFMPAMMGNTPAVQVLCFDFNNNTVMSNNTFSVSEAAFWYSMMTEKIPGVSPKALIEETQLGQKQFVNLMNGLHKS